MDIEVLINEYSLTKGKTNLRNFCTDSLVEITNILADKLRHTGDRRRILAITSLQVRVAKVLRTRVGHVVDGEN